MRSFMRLIDRSSVDLPLPEGPMSAVTRWGGISVANPRTARNRPYQIETSSRRMIGSTAAGVPKTSGERVDGVAAADSLPGALAAGRL